MTHKSSYVDIMVALLSHPGPMTLDGLAAECGLRRSSIERAWKTLLEKELVQKGEPYVNPGTGRQCAVLEPGPLVQEWARRRDE